MEERHATDTHVLDEPTGPMGDRGAEVSILDCITELVVHHDTHMTVLWANKAACDSAGLTAAELAGRHCYEVWHDRQEPCVGCPVRQALTTGIPQSKHMTSYSGKVRFIKGYPVRDPAGMVTGAVGVTMDLTQHKRAELLRRQSEEKYRMLVEQSLQGIAVVQDMRFVFANAAVAKMVGHTVEEILAFGPDDVKGLVHPDSQDMVWERYASRMSGKDGPQHYEVRGIRNDGTTWWAEICTNLVTYEGRPAIQVVVIDITERKRAEQALRKSEELHRSLVENTDEIIFTLDTRGRFTYISPVVERMLGYDPADIIGQPFNCFVHPDDAPGLLVAFERSFSAHNRPYEFRVLAKDGSTHYVRVSCRPVSDEDRLMGLTGIMADVTESKMAEVVLKESEEMYETLVRATTDAVIVTDLQGNITRVSSRTVELFGYDTAEDLIGKSVFELAASKDHKKASANLKTALKQGFMRSSEYVVLRRDGTQFTAEVDAALIRDARGNPKAFITTMRDITERKRAEKALRASDKRFKDIAENASEWIWEVDVNGVYTYSSPVVKKILGYEPKEVLGRHFHDFFHPSDKEHLRQAVFDTFKTKKPFHEFIQRNIHKNGKIVWLSTSGVPVLDDDGNLLGYRGADTDVTEQRMASHDMRVERECLMRTLDAIGDGVIVTDTAGTVVVLNECARGLIACREEEALGKRLSEVFDLRENDADISALDIVSRVLEGSDGSKLAGRATLVARDGSHAPIAYSAARIISRGDVCGIAIIFKRLRTS